MRERRARRESECPRKIFIGGLAHKTTTQHLRDHFGCHGAIVDAVVLRWPDGRSRGFGYVTFAEADAAADALGSPHDLGGRVVDVKRAVPGTNKLFVGGLPQSTSARELREHFTAFGVVSDAVVMIDPNTHRLRGFGFVCFLPGQEGASAVAAALRDYELHRIRGKWIEVKSATPPHKLKRVACEFTGSDEGLCEERGPVTAVRPVPSPLRALTALGEPKKVPLETWICHRDPPPPWPSSVQNHWDFDSIMPPHVEELDMFPVAQGWHVDAAW